MACSPRKIVVAIDGYSSCGKSTFARAIARRMGYLFVDTGAMYRAVTLFAIRTGAVGADGALDVAALVARLPEVSVTFRLDPATGVGEVYLGDENVEERIRSIEVSRAVTAVSQVPGVRAKLVALQQCMGRDRGLVMDGRDIGTVVFPDAELKIFMTADPAVRARRRYDELRAKGQEVPLAEIEENIRSRDEADRSRAISPLRQAADAIVLDNSHMTLDEQMEWVAGLIDGLVCTSK